MVKPNFREKLIEVRKRKGLTQKEVAEMCNLTTRTIERIESGQVNPRDYTIRAISQKLGFDYFDTSTTENDDATRNAPTKLENHILIWYLKDLFNLKSHAMKKISILSTTLLVISFLVVSILDTHAQSEKPEKMEALIIEYSKDNSLKRIEAAFTHSLTMDSLIRIKKVLKGHGITLTYRKLEFDKNDRLTAIDGRVDFNNGFSGTWATNALKNNKKRSGFFRDYRKGVKYPFGTGQLD